jgi:hypothetical protein
MLCSTAVGDEPAAHGVWTRPPGWDTLERLGMVFELVPSAAAILSERFAR